MSNHTTYGAAALLASLLVGVAVTAATVRAETATAPASADDCLDKPNGPTPRGSHWYYRLDHANNRQCWYLRPTISNAGQSETKQSRAAAAPTAWQRMMAATDPPIGDMRSNPLADTAARNISRNASPPVSSPANQPASAPDAPSTSIDREPMQTGDGVADRSPIPSLTESRTDGANPNQDAKPAKRTAPAPLTTERPALPVVEPTHVPALLGIGLALALIVFGSFGVRLIFNHFRRPRRRVALDLPASSWGAPSFHVDDAPGIVPGTLRRPDIRRAARERHEDRNDPDRAPPSATRRDGHRAYQDRRMAQPDERTHRNRGEEAHPQGREAVGIIEDDVRELLRRLRSEPQGRPTRT